MTCVPSQGYKREAKLIEGIVERKVRTASLVACVLCMLRENCGMMACRAFRSVIREGIGVFIGKVGVGWSEGSEARERL